MRNLIIVSLLFQSVCAVNCLAQESKDEPDDRRVLQGSWKAIEQLPKAEPNVLVEKIVFDGDKLVFHYKLDDQRSKSETAFQLDPVATPKRIDFTPTEGSNKNKTYLGIYEIKDRRLKVCYRGPGLTRPKDFKDMAQGNQSSVYVVLESLPAR